ncbi:MAG: LysM peptidoglycan-binding domain-containing protein [Anaerolineales bacterium]
MDVLRQIGGSILLAMFSVALVIGGISLALAESYVPEIPPTPTETSAPVPVFNSPTPQPIVLPTQTLFIPSATVPPPTTCPPPTGWVPITVQPGDSLATLASEFQVTSAQLSIANCLFSNSLLTGSIIYVPPVPTKTIRPCGPPAGWVRYTVQPGNTMTSLSLAFGVSISQLQFANCMSSTQYYLAVGQSIWVPNIPTRTPYATATRTLTPVIIVFPTSTRTATSSPTSTISPTATNTPTSTNIPTGTATSTATGVPPSPTWTSPPPTATPTATVTITAFPSSTPTTPAPSQ